MATDAAYWNNVDPKQIVADSIIDSEVTSGLSSAYLANQTSEITYESQTAGPDLLTLTMIDPDWQIQTSGLCDKDSDGLLPFVDINFPQGTDCWFRLNEVANQGGDLTTPSLQLVFQHRLVSYLQWDWGALKVAPNTRTRAQFVKQLVDRIPGSLTPDVIGGGSARSHQIQFVCPQLNVIQPLAQSTSTSAQSDNTSAKANKGRGIPQGANLQVLGGTITNRQIDVVNAGLRACAQYNVPEIVMVAMIYAGMGESHLGALTGYQNVWQSSYSIPSVTTQAQWWLTGGPSDSGFGGSAPYPAGHGAIAVYKANPNYAAWQIAGDTERNAVWDNSQGDSYGGYWSGGQSEGIQQAKAIVAAFGGSSADGTSGDATETISDVSQLERGGPDNPDEDSWTCIQRLASEVNWLAFTSCHPAEGQWGNFLYYMTAPRLDKQMPTGTFTRSDDNPGTWDLTHGTKRQVQTITNVLNQQPTGQMDNSAFNYRVTRKKHGKLQRKTRIVKPQNPTQVQLQVNGLEPMTYNAGEVVTIANSGWANGRWIITDNTRNIIEDPFATLTLGPPTTPDPEPVTTVSTSGTKWAAGDDNFSNYPKGTAARALAAAQFLSNQKLPYIYGGDRSVSAPPTTGMDCSGSTSWVLYQGGFTLPGGSTTDAPVAADYISWDQSGEGSELTVWASTGHVFIEFHMSDGTHLQLNTVNPGDLGPRLISWSYSNADAGSGAGAAGFVPRHPRGS